MSEGAQEKMEIRRALPGLAVRTNDGRVEFYRGYVIYASSRIQYVELRHSEHRLVFLIGDTYLYWCPACKISVWEQELQLKGTRRCPFCLGWLQAVGEGDKVRCHYRHAPDASWGQWWAERWQW